MNLLPLPDRLHATALSIFAGLTLACSGLDAGTSGSSSETGTEGSGSSGLSGTDSATSTGGTGSATGTGTGGGSATSGPDTATSTATTGTGGSSTGGECPPDRVHYGPGCGDPPAGVPVAEAGCYFPCTQGGTECGDDVCAPIWADPCPCPMGNDCCGACGGEVWVCTPSGGATGDECQQDADCTSGVCWDFADYDPLCFGTACSGGCMTDADCEMLAAGVGAPTPSAATCGSDQLCDLVGTGLGSWACAALTPSR